MLLIIKIATITIIIAIVAIVLIMGLLKFLIGTTVQSVIDSLNEKPLFDIFGFKIVSLNTGDLTKRNSNKINKIKYSGKNEIWTIDLPW